MSTPRNKKPTSNSADTALRNPEKPTETSGRGGGPARPTLCPICIDGLWYNQICPTCQGRGYLFPEGI